MCQIFQYFQIHDLPFLIIWSRFSNFHLRVTFRQHRTAISKKKHYDFLLLQKLFSFPSAPGSPAGRTLNIFGFILLPHWLSCSPLSWLLHSQNAELAPSVRATSHALHSLAILACGFPGSSWYFNVISLQTLNLSSFCQDFNTSRGLWHIQFSL